MPKEYAWYITPLILKGHLFERERVMDKVSKELKFCQPESCEDDWMIEKSTQLIHHK